uniref:Uncharacterized protein n=1 Tax=Aegilops tauschii subsp. strangulata TaxID=200361 RepID=A0A453M8D8_AEGTS
MLHSAPPFRHGASRGCSLMFYLSSLLANVCKNPLYSYLKTCARHYYVCFSCTILSP